MISHIQTSKVGFIGAGNMATSLIKGLLDSGLAAGQIFVSDPNKTSRESLASLGIQVCETNRELASMVDALVFAVKPQIFSEPAEEVADILQKRKPLVISIAAGIPLSAISGWVGEGLPLVRTMPNTPALIGQGITALYAGDTVKQEHKQLAETLMQAVGDTLWVDEERLIDASTAVSGSGPAYVFAFIEALTAAAEDIGLESSAANQLVIKTLQGATALAQASDDSVSTLREKVTSPGGTTEAALKVLQQEGFDAVVKKAVSAAMQRAEELSS